jgi:UDP-2,3-diacylglucosamine hydrolase
MNNAAASGGPLAIICGAGKFPYAVADAVARRGRRVVLFGLVSWADPTDIVRYPHHWVRLAQLGRFRRLALQEGCHDVVLIGALTRPSIPQLRVDFTTIRNLPRIIAAYRGGDNHLLSHVGKILEQLGFRMVGAHEVAPEILVPEGCLGRHAPSPRDLADIAIGQGLLAAMGPFDVGQATVVAAHRVVAVEAAEGTDRMLARVAELRRDRKLHLPAKIGVLIKAPKPDQDRRFDLPSVGAKTVEAAAMAGLAGIAVEAKGAITADLHDLVRAADAAGLFVVGVAPQASPRGAP